MTQVQFLGPNILIRNNKVALDPNCCCDETPCICDETTEYPPCSCTNEDFGEVFSQPDILFTITGSLTPTPVNPFGGGDLCSGICPDISGSYLRNACSAELPYLIYTYVCTTDFGFGNRDVYYRVGMALVTGVTTIEARFYADMQDLSPGSPNPYPTWTQAAFPLGFAGALRRRIIYNAIPTHVLYDNYKYENIGSCKPECNTVIQFSRCMTGVSLSSDTGTDLTANGCQFGSLSVGIALV